MSQSSSQVRMYAILARKARFGVVFRAARVRVCFSSDGILRMIRSNKDNGREVESTNDVVISRRTGTYYFTSLPAIANCTIPGQPSADLHTLPRWHCGRRAMGGEVAVTSYHSTGLHSTIAAAR